MKNILLILITICAGITTYAQDMNEIVTDSLSNDNNSKNEDFTVKGDTTKVRIGTKEIHIIEKDGKTSVDIFDASKNRIASSEMEDDGKKKEKDFKIYYSGVSVSLNNFIDARNSLSRSADAQFMDLNTEKSIAWNINLLEYGWKIMPHVALVTGLGFEFNNYRFDNNNNIKKVNGVIVEKPVISNALYKKSKLFTSFAHVPILLQLYSNQGFYFSVGVQGAIKMTSYTRENYELNEQYYKEKKKDDFNILPFKYEIMVRSGYKHLNLFASYSLSPFFENQRGPELYPISLGFFIANF